MLAWSVDPNTKDLVFDGTNPKLINGTDKLIQDIRWAVVAKKGLDRFHPSWGTRISAMIGTIDLPDHFIINIYKEVINALNAYHNQIIATMEKARFTGQTGYFSKFVASSYGELIKSIDNVNVDLAASTSIRLKFDIIITTETNIILSTTATVSV